MTKNETVSWDFEEGPRSDDEDLQDNLDGLNAAPESKGDKAGAEGPLIFDGTDGAFSDGEDADGQGTLSSFGQVKHVADFSKTPPRRPEGLADGLAPRGLWTFFHITRLRACASLRK